MKSSSKTNIFIIDDDKVLTKAVKNELEKNFSEYKVRISTFEAGEKITFEGGNQPDVAIVDFHLNGGSKNTMDGVKVIAMIKSKSPETEVVMFTGEESADIAVKAMHQGAHDYVVKNDNMFRKLNMAVYQCLKLKELKEELNLQKKLSYLSVILISLFVGVATTVSVLS